MTRSQRDDSHRLALVPLLRGVDDDRLSRLAAQVTERRFGPDHAVRTQGEPADRLPLLMEGTVVVLRATPDGRELRLGQLVGPCALDKTAVLDGEGHTATFRAQGECLVWSVTRADLPVPGSQQVLADTLGLSRVTVNRALKALERDGLVRVARDHVVILVPELLAAQAAAGR